MRERGDLIGLAGGAEGRDRGEDVCGGVPEVLADDADTVVGLLESDDDDLDGLVDGSGEDQFGSECALRLTAHVLLLLMVGDGR